MVRGSVADRISCSNGGRGRGVGLDWLVGFTGRLAQGRYQVAPRTGLRLSAIPRIVDRAEVDRAFLTRWLRLDLVPPWDMPITVEWNAIWMR